MGGDAAQAPPAAPQGRGAGTAEGGRQGGGGRGSAYLPTEEQWAAMSPKAKEYVDKARAIAADDPELQFDFGIFCKASGGAQNGDRATVGVPNSEPKLQPYPAPSPAAVVGGQRLFDNFYWIGNTGIGVWLITSNDGYIMFDTMNSEEDARDLVPARRCRDQAEALVVRSLLDSEGISSVLRGHFVSALHPFSVGEQGAITVLVHAFDVLRARALLTRR